MNANQFLQCLRNASTGERAEATGALARAYLYSDLSADDHIAAEAAMLMLLDDPSPLVHRALADALAPSSKAPPAVIYALAADQPQIAAPVLALSPLFVDADLVDAVATNSSVVQTAIASRAALPRSVAAALAEIGSAEACLTLLENRDADIAPCSIDRIAERHGHLAAIREPLLARDDISTATRHMLLTKLANTVAGFVAARGWMDVEKAQHLARDACEKATVTLASELSGGEIGLLIRHLRESGQLTASLILRALLSGHIALFEEAVAELAGLPVGRVTGLVSNGSAVAVSALLERAGLPPSTSPAFKEAIATMREGVLLGESGDAARLKRRMIERVLTRCENQEFGELAPLITLLHRFATEAAREDARLFCAQLAAEDFSPQPTLALMAA
jgi:uncharacterized protein (DUF2336 family)